MPLRFFMSILQTIEAPGFEENVPYQSCHALSFQIDSSWPVYTFPMFHDVVYVCQFQKILLFVAALLLQLSQFRNHGARLIFDDHHGLRARARLPVVGPGVGKKKIREQAAELVLQLVEAG